jgi:site-specific recombinase XerD
MDESLPDLAALLPSWKLALQSENKAPGTVKSYSDGVLAFLRWADATGTPAVITKANAQAWIAGLIDRGAESQTAITRQRGLRQYARWLADEGELDADPLLGLKRPKEQRKVVPSLTDVELRALIDACRGKTLKHRRDEAIVRLIAETGLRAAELLGLTVADVDLVRGLAVVKRGKGSKGRIVPFGPQSGAALDRYMRAARRENRLTDAGPLWVGAAGKTFGYHGLNGSLKERAAVAGIAKFHVHRLRHTAATRWLRLGGSEQGLMAVAGWSSRAMIDRYTGASASERAAVESRSLDLGNI